MKIDNLKKMIDEKYIVVRKHPTEDLWIYDYTNRAQFDKVWNEETLMCRGLIMDKDYTVKARPFKKFFNLEELGTNAQLPAEDFEVTEKLDGSLGIMYWIGDIPYLATRGSFESEQALKGTEILREKYPNVQFNPDYTYLFEIIYPENRIVVDYKGLEDLILLAVIDTKSGLELDGSSLPMPQVQRFDGITDINKLKELKEDNKEGFVVRFTSGLRLKIKFEEYVRLHKLITGVNARRIWELLANHQSMDELLERVPDEFYKWVSDTKNGLMEDYMWTEKEAIDRLHIVNKLPSRKEQALSLQDFHLRSVVFKMLDEQPYEDLIWKMLKPKHEIPFKIEI